MRRGPVRATVTSDLNDCFVRIVPKLGLGLDAGVTFSMAPATGWSRSVRPFTGLRLGKTPPRCLLPIPAGRGADGRPRLTAVRMSGGSKVNSYLSTGQCVATSSIASSPRVRPAGTRNSQSNGFQ